MPPKNVFIVEDEAVVAMDLESRLRKLGYEFSGCAASGEEAIRRIEESQPDVVLMDIRLEGELDGIEVAAAIRRLDIPVVFVTAFSDEGTLQRARMTQPYGYVLKPFEERELRISIEIAAYRHAVEKKLHAMERWLATTLNSVGDGVIAIDLNGVVTYLNPIAELLTGWPREEAIGRRFEEIFMVHNTATGAIVENVAQKALSEGLVVSLAANSTLVTRQSFEKRVDDSAAPLRDDQNRIIGAVIVFRDISERVKVERELADSQERLRQSEKLEAIGRLAGGVAHDFNNLLTVTLGHAELLLQTPSLLPNDRRHVEAMHAASVRAAELTRQLLAYSRKQVLRPRAMDINEVLQRMSNMLRRLLSEDIILEEQFASGLGIISIDPAQFEQVLMNLAVNARDAMPKGGSLFIQTENIILDDETSRAYDVSPGRFVLLTVKDTGTGIDDATRARVFEPFFTTKPVGKGTGLGLSTVYGIVKQSRGHVEVRSTVGQGTELRLYFPCIDEVGIDEHSTAGITPEHLAKGSEHILIVEDNEMVRDMLKETLTRAGYSTIEAAGSAEALTLFKRIHGDIDLVVTDIVMPGITGLDLIKQMRALRPNLKALFMSGYGEEAVLRYGVLESGTAFVSKPFTPRVFGLKLRGLLDSRNKEPI
jgi:two-component system cell cycle sensor histidine kinase/response regulator CckA